MHDELQHNNRNVTEVAKAPVAHRNFVKQEVRPQSGLNGIIKTTAHSINALSRSRRPDN